MLERNLYQNSPQFCKQNYTSSCESDTKSFYQSAGQSATTRQARQLLAILHAGSAHAFLQRIDGDTRRTLWYTVGGKLPTIPAYWLKSGAIYFGVSGTTTRITDSDRAKYAGKPDSYIEQRVASKNATIAAVNALISEFDGKDETKPTPAEVEPFYQALRSDPANAGKGESALQNEALNAAKKAKYLTDPAHYKTLAMRRIMAAPLAPSVIVDSGGGYQAYWLFTETFHLRTDEDRARAAKLQADWVKLTGGDPGAKDVRRVLRLPGTVNYKKGYGAPVVKFIRADFDLRYELADLESMIPTPAPAPQRQATGKSYQPITITTPGTTGPSVIDAFNAGTRIANLLASYGYTQSGGKWKRPGGASGSVVVFADSNTSFHHSSSDPLHSEHARSPFDLYCHFEHAGNVREAVKAAALAMGMERPQAERQAHQERSAKELIEHARQWLQSANFADLIPQELQSAKGYRTLATDKRLYSAFLDILARYKATSGPISNMQLSLASGVSEGTVRNSLKKLMGAGLIARMAPPEDSEGGAFWYRLVISDEIVSCVPCAVYGSQEEKHYRAKYATETFTTHKTHDAFQRGGSKRQRRQATIKAFGPDALIVVDVLADYGPQSQQAIAQRTHQSKFTVSRLVARLEAAGAVEVQQEWRRSIVSLSAEWLEITDRLTPQMPTYGMSERRQMSAAIRTMELCDYLLAKGKGDAGKLAERSKAASVALLQQAEREMASIFDQDRQGEALHRMATHAHQQRQAAITVSNWTGLEATQHIARFMQNERIAPWLERFDAGKVERMRQTLQNNEDLIFARAQLKAEES